MPISAILALITGSEIRKQLLKPAKKGPETEEDREPKREPAGSCF